MGNIVGYTGEKCKNCGHPDNDHTHPGGCHWQQHGALPGCNCRTFVSPTMEAIDALPYEDQKLLACANYFSGEIDPDCISNIEIIAGDNQSNEIRFILHIPTDQQLDE